MARRNVDPFDVWGKPPPLLRTLTKRQLASLRWYVTKIVDKAYRVGRVASGAKPE